MIEVVAEGVPAGLGAPIYGKLDADLAAALMCINAVKGVEIGAGFAAAALSGEENADEMRMGNDGKPLFLSNHAGGILGGISTGQPIVVPLRGQADLVDPDAARAPSTATAPRPRSSPRAATTPASASAPCRSARRWWPACSPITICAIAARSASRRPGPLRRDATEQAPQRRIEATNERSQLPASSTTPSPPSPRGEIVVVTDDDDRENEGDLFVAASLCTPEKMAFIIRHTSGIVCAPLSAERGQAPASRSDGGAERCAARHRLHRLGRRPPRPHHRHLGRGAHQHRARARQRQ